MLRTRRGFLRHLLGATFTGATVLDQAVFRAARARAQAATPGPVLFDLDKVADGIWAALARPQTLLNSNATIFEMSDGLLILDAHSKPSAVGSLVRQLRTQVTQKPVRYVVASHFHWDHSHGLPAYRKIAPRADIVASEPTRRMIDSQTLPRLKAALEQIAAQVESLKKGAAAATNARDKSELAAMARESEEYLREMQSFPVELPNVTISRDLVLHDKDRELHLAFRGLGHTAGDLVVFCPQYKTVATGDLLHGFLPFIGDGYPAEWPITLLGVAQFEFTNIAGGHGGVFRSRDRLYQMGNYIEELTERVVRGQRAGKPVEALEREITPAVLRSLADGGFGMSSAETILKYRRIPPPLPSAAEVLADGLRQNVQQVYAALGRG
jgi:glyoxylase-like metal-dependent hydrolase (beta-lactamase superfamily II)